MISEHDSSPESRLENLLENALQILAELVEKIGSMDPQRVQGLRQQLVNLLVELQADDVSYLAKLAVRLARYKDNPPKPENYPSKSEFKEALVKNSEIWRANSPELFTDLEARGGDDLLLYLYGLGIIMTAEIAYQEIFKNDLLEVENGVVTNGRHRALTKLFLEKAGFPVSGLTWV